MLDDENKPVIIDLGLGQEQKKSMDEHGQQQNFGFVQEATTNPKGSLLWMPPEMIKEKLWSEKTDIYALGMVMYEIMSGKLPFHEMMGGSIHDLVTGIVDGRRPNLADIKDGDPQLIHIMQRCWHSDPEKRPTARRILRALRPQSPAKRQSLPSSKSDMVTSPTSPKLDDAAGTFSQSFTSSGSDARARNGLDGDDLDDDDDDDDDDGLDLEGRGRFHDAREGGEEDDLDDTAASIAQRAKHMFNKFDTKKDGSGLCLRDFMLLVEKLMPTEVSAATVVRLYDAIDIDKDKGIKFPEFFPFWVAAQRNGFASAISLCSKATYSVEDDLTGESSSTSTSEKPHLDSVSKNEDNAQAPSDIL